MKKISFENSPRPLGLILAAGFAAVLLSWTAAAQGPAPLGIIYAPGDLIVVDIDRAGLFKIDPATGARETIVTWDHNRWTQFLAVRYDDKGAVSDFFVNRYDPGAIIRIDPYTGEETEIASGFDYSGHLVVDENGDVIFVDNSHGLVRKVDPETLATTVVSAGFITPYPLAIEKGGTLIVGDSESVENPTGPVGKIYRVNPATGEKTVLSVGPFDWSTAALAVDGNGDILTGERRYYAEGTVGRIDKTTGVRTVVAYGYPLTVPAGIDVEKDGHIVVADYKTGPGDPSWSGKVLRVDPVTGDQTLITTDGGAPTDVKIVGRPVWINTPPVADNLSVSASSGASCAVDVTAADLDGDVLGYVVLTGPAHGALTGDAPHLTYTAEASYFGPDSFTFKANDGSADSNVATVTIAVNHVPVAVGQSLAVEENKGLTIALGDSIDVDGDPLTYAVLTGPGHGTVTITGDQALYTPTEFYYGPDSFEFQANDTKANSNIAVVSITVKRIFASTRFEAPVDNEGIINSAKAGASIPVRWRLTDLDGTPISDAKSFVGLTSYVVSCIDLSGEPIDEVEAYTGASGLQYLGDGVWQFNWKTSKAYAGQCRIMVLTLSDGSKHLANFKFK